MIRDTIIVTRHPGALVYLESLGYTGEIVGHLDPTQITVGTTVIGILPVQLIAAVLAAGGQYIGVVLPELPAEMRGVELTAAQTVEYGAQLVRVNSIDMEETG